jgi:hypothetical protein
MSLFFSVHAASCKMGTGSLCGGGGKAAGVWRWPPPTPSNAEVEGRVELYLYFPSCLHWQVVGGAPFTFAFNVKRCLPRNTGTPYQTTRCHNAQDRNFSIQNVCSVFCMTSCSNCRYWKAYTTPANGGQRTMQLCKLPGLVSHACLGKYPIGGQHRGNDVTNARCGEISEKYRRNSQTPLPR